jgi:hypothetical protein
LICQNDLKFETEGVFQSVLEPCSSLVTVGFFLEPGKQPIQLFALKKKDIYSIVLDCKLQCRISHSMFKQTSRVKKTTRAIGYRSNALA